MAVSEQTRIRELRVAQQGGESHLLIECWCTPPIYHQVHLPLVVKGLIARGAVLYGYDGECQFGGSHSVTFVRQEETRGACPACGEIGKVLEGSKCANCGNPVEAVTVVADHHAEKSVREMLLPGRRNKRP